MNKVKLSTEQILFLKSCGKTVRTKNNKYTIIPFWFREIKGNKFELISLGHFPDDLKEAINKIKEAK